VHYLDREPTLTCIENEGSPDFGWVWSMKIMPEHIFCGQGFHQFGVIEAKTLYVS
jgi:hypothetical protein